MLVPTGIEHRILLPKSAEPFTVVVARNQADAKYAYRARIAGGWLIFICTPGRGGLGGVTFYPDPDHTWDGGTQEGRES